MAHPVKKSFSMGCLPSCYVALSPASLSASSSSSSLVSIDHEHTERVSNGYLSDGLMGRTPDRKKGVPWTEEEHRLFLAGLAKLGKGDWRGISRNFVSTRTPTQVASHAQKYFQRLNSLNQKKRRSSLFDVVAVHASQLEDTISHGVRTHTTTNLNSLEEEMNPSGCLHLMPDSSYGSFMSPSILRERPEAHLHLLDLELSISSSRSTDRNSPSPSSLPIGPIRVL